MLLQGHIKERHGINMVILCIDLGMARTGVAASDPSEFLASPVGTIEEKNKKALLTKLAGIASERNAGRIVVGHPRNMDGSRGESALRAERLAAELERLTGLPVVLRDERLTTVSAAHILNETNTRGKKRKAVIDTVSAVVLLQEYLDSSPK